MTELQKSGFVGSMEAMSSFSRYPTITVQVYLIATVLAQRAVMPAPAGSRNGEVACVVGKLQPVATCLITNCFQSNSELYHDIGNIPVKAISGRTSKSSATLALDSIASARLRLLLTSPA